MDYPYPRKKKNSSRKIALTLTCLLVITTGFFVFASSNNNSTFKDSFTQPFVDPEKANPEVFLNATGTYNKNFWGNKFVIEGTVTNSASHTNYKDVVIEVLLYSSTKSVIETKRFVLYDYFPYGQTKTFKLKFDCPKSAVSCGWDAASAIAY